MERVLSDYPTPEERIESLLLLLEECEVIVMRHQEEHGGVGDLLKRVQAVLG